MKISIFVFYPIFSNKFKILTHNLPSLDVTIYNTYNLLTYYLIITVFTVLFAIFVVRSAFQSVHDVFINMCKIGKFFTSPADSKLLRPTENLTKPILMRTLDC